MKDKQYEGKNMIFFNVIQLELIISILSKVK